MEWTRIGFRYSAEESAHSEFRRRANSKTGNGMEQNSMGKISFTKQPKNKMICMYLKSLLFWHYFEIFGCRVCFKLFSLPRNGSEKHSESLLLFLFHGTNLRVVFSSTEVFGTEFQEFASIFVPRNGISSCFLFHGRIRNRIREFSVPEFHQK